MWPPQTGLHSLDRSNPLSIEYTRKPYDHLGQVGRRSQLSKEQSVSHRMGVETVIERLRNRHGQVRAHRLAVLEQQKARRARCRKRFHFWGNGRRSDRD